jgi:hypothetical protein
VNDGGISSASEPRQQSLALSQSTGSSEDSDSDTWEDFEECLSGAREQALRPLVVCRARIPAMLTGLQPKGSGQATMPSAYGPLPVLRAASIGDCVPLVTLRSTGREFYSSLPNPA